MFKTMLDGLPRLQHVSFVGAGEALFLADFPNYIRLCSTRGIDTSTVTNGLLIPTRLPPAVAAGLGRIGISIDAADDDLLRQLRSDLALAALTRSIRSAVTLCRKTSTRVFAATTLSSATAGRFASIVEYIADCGLREMTVESLHHWGNDKRLNQLSLFAGEARGIVADIEEGLEIAVRLGVHVTIFDYTRLLRGAGFACHCPWPWDGVFLTCHGKVTPCCVNIEASETNALGDLHAESIGGIWVGSKYRAFRESFGTDREWESCRNCVYRLEFGQVSNL
jgi:radical SAM protein with 4Fe4S-binding SPASM domain